jgi:hypothetical protein
MDPTTAGQLGNLGASLLGTGAQMYGQQNAAEAVSKANNAAITNQNTALGNIGNIYQPYTTGGANAQTALGTALGTNGKPADYSGFEHMPGYDFAVQQGTQAIQRQAAASGNAYTPNTQAAIGQYVTGTAMQDYNTYIQQLQAQAGMGATAANSLGNITYNTGANTSQLMSNTGQSQAGMYTGMGQTASTALGGYGNLPPGLAALLGGSGAGGGAGGLGAMFGKGLSYMFGNGDIASNNPQGDPNAGYALPTSPDYGSMTQPMPNFDASTSADLSNLTY